MKVYLAGAIENINPDEATNWRDKSRAFLEAHGIEVVCPIRDGPGILPPDISDEDAYDAVEADFGIMDPCDLIIANLSKPSDGTAMEIYRSAWCNGVPVYGFGYDRRSIFMKVCVDTFFDTLEDALVNAVAYLKMLEDFEGTHI